MRLCVIRVGEKATRWAEDAVGEYAKRLRRYATVEEIAVKPERFRGDIAAVREAEGERILARVGARDRLVCLDERGEAPDTEAFAALLDSARNDGSHRLVFAIGGPYGHDPAVRDRAERSVRLSALVLNHDLARVVLFEQLYRGLSLLAGAPYHH